MRKLNGITINGEYLGNSVVINGMFRAICTISPVIMRDFVLIINKIDRLDEAVKIHNFNCGFDCIDIEFENETSKGMASLYFKLYNGEPLLKDCKLIIDDEEYSTFQEKITLRPKNSKDMTNPNKQSKTAQNSDLDRLQKIRELREKKQAMQNQQKPKPPASNTQNNSVPNRTSPSALTPEEQREQKRKELLDKKRKLLEAKKEKAQNNTIAETQENQIEETVSDGQTKSDTNNKTIQAQPSDSKKSEPIVKTSGLVTQADGTITNEQGQAVVKEERINPDGSISEVYVNPENPDEVYEQNENGEFVNETIVDENPAENIEEFGNDDEYEDANRSSILENLSDEDLENMSDEELAALEAELNAELGEDNSYNSYDDYSSNQTGYQGSNFNFEGFAQELAQGLTDGLTQGLAQGLAQGLSQGFNVGGMSSGMNAGMGMGSGFGNNSGFGSSDFGDSFSGGYSGNNVSEQSFNSAPVQQAMPNYSQIDSMNFNAADMAKDSYSYDENSNIDDISDFYSDFYDNVNSSNEQNMNAQSQQQEEDGELSELDRLKAELEALKAQTEEKKNLMTVEEFMAQQQQLKEEKEKLSRQKMRIVGSNGRVNASALDGGVFAAGRKLYKWGETRILDE